MRSLIVMLAVSCVWSFACAGALAQKAALPGGQSMSPPSIFAYPGKSCPGGSDLYKGPEQTLAAASGAVYCRFVRKFVKFPKKNRSACPPGMKESTDTNAGADPDNLWCAAAP